MAAINIGGALPFAPAGNPELGVAQLGAGLGMPAGAVQGLNTLAAQYGQSYQSALQQNQAMYNNILGGYQQLMGAQQSAQQPIQQGYANLQQQVLGDISGIGASEKQAIADAYAQQSGGMSQSLINRGLGNATVSDTMQRGLQFDKQKAEIALSNQMAQLTAGYRSNLGLAGLNYQNQANMQNTALGTQQLNWMNSVNMGYPDPGQYNALFGQAGQQNQANLDRQLQQQLMAARRNPFGGGGGGGAGGVPPIHLPYSDPFAGGSMFGPQDYGGGGAMAGYIPGAGGQNYLQQQAQMGLASLGPAFGQQDYSSGGMGYAPGVGGVAAGMGMFAGLSGASLQAAQMADNSFWNPDAGASYDMGSYGPDAGAGGVGGDYTAGMQDYGTDTSAMFADMGMGDMGGGDIYAGDYGY